MRHFKKLSLTLTSALLLGISMISATPASASGELSVTPTTWDIIGLKSNNSGITDGPERFPVGARVCNATGATLSGAQTKLVWDSSNSYVYLSGSDTNQLGDLLPGKCADSYYIVQIDRTSAAWNTTREYHIEASADGGATGSSPQPRQLYVEKLNAQNRNDVYAISGAGGCNADYSVCDPAPTDLEAGKEYTYKVYAETASAYEQLEAFLSFPGDFFRVKSITSEYQIPSGATIDGPYANACGWDPVPTSATYRSCIGPIPAQFQPDGKVGGKAVVTYKVVATGVGTGSLRALIYDYSGNSYHYNQDYPDIPVDVTVKYPLDVEIIGQGNVKTDVGGIDCGLGGTKCKQIYKKDTLVTLAAQPGEGQEFLGWSGDGCSGTEPTCAVTMDQARKIVATFSDKKKGEITVQKSLSPQDDPGLFDLKIDGATKALGVGDGGTTGAQSLWEGEYTISEAASSSSPNPLSDYNASLECKDGDEIVPSVEGKIDLDADQKIVCVFTNTRKTGTIQVDKSLSPTDDPGLFDLKINDQTEASGVGDGGTTGKKTLPIGTYSIAEASNSGSPTTLEDYNSSLECKDDEDTVPVEEGKVELDEDQNIVCVFTNTRKAGTLTVKKSLSPTDDPGLFDLSIDGKVKAEGVGDGGSTGEQYATMGEHNVAETTNSASPTTLADYNSSLECKDGEEVLKVVDGNVQVGDKQNIVCVFLNTRRAGTLTVKKSLSPTSDPGLFDLQIDGATKAEGVGDGGTTGAQYATMGEHTVGEAANASSPTSLTDYNTKIDCQAPDSRSIAPAVEGKVEVGDGQDIVCVITNTRKTGQLELRKSLSPAQDPGRFDLKIDGNVEASGVGNDGTTGLQEVTAGEYSLSEEANASSPATLADYNSKLACEDEKGPVNADNGKVEVESEQKVVCTFTNTRKAGTLTVKKSLSPTDDPGLFGLKIDDQTKAEGVGDGGTTGEQYALAGEHTVSESANASSPTTLTDYNSSLECRDGEEVVSSTGGRVEVGDGQNVVCVFTNIRKAGTLTVKKILSPAQDPGLFDLKIDGTTKAEGVGDGGTTGEQSVVAGEHTVSETTNASSPNPMELYKDTLECRDGDEVVSSTDGKVEVEDGQKIICTFINVRKTGQVTVKKSLSPAQDPGLFDLKIDDVAKASGVGDGGTTGAQTLPTGEHTVSEASNSGSPTTLADYNTGLECRDEKDVVPSEGGKIYVDENQQIVCIFTNTRKAGTLTVKKSLSPTQDPGRFDLKIDGTAKAEGVGDGGTTGEQYALAGEHTVSEAANATSPTLLADYNSSLECKAGDQTVASTDGKVEVGDGQNIVCIFTNTRKTGSIVLQKSLSPTSDPGLFDLKIDDSVKASGVGDGGSTGTQEVLPGSYLLSEAANSGSPTTLADYNSSLECKDSQGTVPVQDGKVDVAADQKVTCTFTNTRKAGTLTVNKSLSPAQDPGRFDLKIDGTTKASSVGDGGTTGEQYAPAGEHTVGEDTNASSPTTLADYDASLECKDGEQTVASTDGKVQIGDGQKIVCTFLNTRKQAAQYPLTAAVVGNGTVTSNVGGINCPGVLCNQDYAPDTVVTLVPKASAGWVFQGWTGDCTNKTGNCVVTMSQARNVTAVFAAVAPSARFTLRTQILPRGKGRVRATGGVNCISTCLKTYTAGTLVKLTERPKRGYYFVRWSGACRKYGRKNYCRVRMNRSQSVYALYRKIPTRPRFTG